MAAEKSPAFQFYPKDFMMDGNVMAMTLAERGAYITLICWCWLEGQVPTEMSALARLCKVSTPAFKRLWPALEPCFEPIAANCMIQPRIERERKKQEAYRVMKAEAGRQGGRPKAEVIKCLSTTEAGWVAEQSPPSSSSSSSPSPTDVTKNPLPPKGGRVTREDRKEAKRIRNLRFGQCQHAEPCDSWKTCEALIAQELADRRIAS